jgi:hypothetical protein
MSDTPKEHFSVTADDLRCYDWQARIATSKQPDCHDFYTLLIDAAKECRERQDDLGCRVHSLLGLIASFLSNYDAKSPPYTSMWSGIDGRRSLNAEDLTDADLDALSGIVTEIKDPEYRARVADVIWVTHPNGNFQIAKLAVAAFLESADRVKGDDSWVDYADRLGRAAQIASKRGFEAERAAVVKAIESGIVEYEQSPNPNLVCERLMSILLLLEEGDSVRYAALSERLALHFRSVGNWLFSENYWQLAERWHRMGKRDADVHRCQLEVAECNISNAEAGIEKKGALFASHWLSRGLIALRAASAPKARIVQIHQRLLEVQRLSLGELKTLEIGEEWVPGMSAKREEAQAAVAAFIAGHDIQEALRRVAYVNRPTDYAQIKKQHVEQAKHSLAEQVFGSTTLDQSGKVSEVQKPVIGADLGDQERTLRQSLCNQAVMIFWPINVVCRIEPARTALLSEHAVRLHDLRHLVTFNHFIPPGHAGIFERGLHAGFYGDWLVAMHLLIPQIEASIRHVLQHEGVVTSTLESDGTQKEWDLNTLLWKPDVERIFGPNILFDLRGILTEKFGHNLRNDLAHGLLPECGYYRDACTYLWWLVLFLCYQGHVIAVKASMVEPAALAAEPTASGFSGSNAGSASA